MTLLQDRGRETDFDAHVTGIQFVGDQAAFALGDGTVRFASITGDSRVEAHDGACLSMALAPDGGSVLTAGDDGRLVRTSPEGATETLAETGGKWIDHVAVAANGAIAWSAGRSVHARVDGETRRLDAASSVGGLAFAPKGTRLAVAHYNGVALWYAATEASVPQKLEWKGAHTGVTFSPDGRFVVTRMQENAMHGWRLADGQHMRMTGYPSKVRDFSWSARGRWLATTGAEALVLWPFEGKTGPTGKPARQVGVRPQITTAVACHPKTDVVAAGFADGLIFLIRLEDGAEILLADKGGGAVTSIAWNPAGHLLAFGTEEGRAGIVAL